MVITLSCRTAIFLLVAEVAPLVAVSHSYNLILILLISHNYEQLNTLSEAGTSLLLLVEDRLNQHMEMRLKICI